MLVSLLLFECVLPSDYRKPIYEKRRLGGKNTLDLFILVLIEGDAWHT